VSMLAAVAAVLAAAFAATGTNGTDAKSYRIDNRDCGYHGARLRWRDGHRRLALADCVTNGLRSPDGRLLVVGDAGLGRLRFVDLSRRRLVYAPRIDLSTLNFATVRPLLWTHLNRVVATTWTGDAHRTAASGLVVVDPVARRIVSRVRLGEAAALPGRTDSGHLVLFAAPRDRIGQARIVVVSPAGRITQIRVERIRAGLGGHGRFFNRVPGVAFDVRGARVFVVAEGDGAAEVDLRGGSVEYHRLPRAFAARPRELAPPGESSGTSNPARTLARQARWLGNGVVAVAGYDTWPTRGGNEQRLGAGLKLLDTRSWSVRTVDRLADHVVYAPGLILVARERWDPERRNVVGDGVVGYDVRGRRRFHVLAGRRAVVSRVRGRRVSIWLHAPPKRASPGGLVVALPSGRVVTRLGRLAPNE
jgi:hypothetical protein